MDLPARCREAPPAADHLRIELSALTGGRVSAGPVSVGIGALSFADLAGWLLGFGARIDRYTMAAQSTTVVDLAALAGHRFRWSDLALDVVAGPALIVLAEESDVRRGAITLAPDRSLASGPLLREERSRTLPRFVSGARLTFRARSTFRTFVGIDGELGPGGDPWSGSEPLPVATLGLTLGATVGTR